MALARCCFRAWTRVRRGARWATPPTHRPPPDSPPSQRIPPTQAGSSSARRPAKSGASAPKRPGLNSSKVFRRFRPYSRSVNAAEGVGFEPTVGLPHTRSLTYVWRKGWDSNPRRPCSLNAFQERRNQPSSATLPKAVWILLVKGHQILTVGSPDVLKHVPQT